MTGRIVYEGSIAIDGDGYTETIERDGDWLEEAIPKLDELVTRKTHLRFTLEYPFEQAFSATIVGDGGVSLRMIIDAVRRGYREIYRGAAHHPIPGLRNQLVQGAYGRAVHAMGDLVIESIRLDEGAGLLDIDIGS